MLAALGSLWLLAWSLPVVSHTLRAQLEDAYRPVVIEEVPRAQAVGLLGGGIRPTELSGQMPNLGSAADRVWLAARLFKAGKGPKVLVSGGSDRTVYVTSEVQAIIAALQVLQAVVRSGQSLAQLLAGLTLFPQTMINVRLQPGADWQQNQALKAGIAAAEVKLAGRGRVLIRASGTEPLLRVMVEADDADLAEGLAKELAQLAGQ